MPDAAATRRRILDAAAKEFADHGIAGARVDRIAEAAAASKPMLYAYFGSKEGLFEAVFTSRVLANSGLVVFTADDLAGYAVRLYDYYLAHPELVRIVLWKRLELDAEGYLYTGLEQTDLDHLRAIKTQQKAGLVRADLNPADIWSLLIAMSQSWAQGSITTVATPDQPRSAHRRRRRALRDAVRAAMAPPDVKV